jgi:hypothetical protein
MSLTHPSQLLLSCCLLLVACSGAAGTANPETSPTPGGAGQSTSPGSGGSAGSESAGTSSAGGNAPVGGSAGSAGSELGGSAADTGRSGAGSLGGAGTNGGSAGGGGAPFVPGPIDFRAWKLQLPTGSGTSPTTISSAQLLAGFSNDYFYIAPDGGQAFMDPATGITTSGSQHCRTEMREQTPGAGDAAWPSTGTHSMTVEGQVVKLGGGSIAVGQLFNGTDSIPLCELQYTSSHKFSLLYEEAKGGGSSTDLKTAVALNTRYTFVLAMVDGQLSVSIDGKQVYTHTPSAGILDNKFYFKFGNYDQSSSAGTPSTTPYSIVEAYKVDVVHQ